MLEILLKDYKNLCENRKIISYISDESEAIQNEMSELVDFAKKNGLSISRCGNCGSLVQGTAGHVDA